MARLVLDKATFFFECTHAERDIPRDAGFRWSKAGKGWYTIDLAAAVRLRDYATGEAKRKLTRLLIKVSPWTLPLPPSPPGLKRKPFQTKAVKFALARNSSYLRLCPGLGKTPVAACIARACRKGFEKAVFVTPPFLVHNVVAEFAKWAPDLTTAIYGWDIDPIDADVMVLPDTQMSTELRLLLASHPAYSTIFVDEAHRFKTGDAKRTVALFGDEMQRGYIDHFSRRVFMSGTPMPNRPFELFPLLSKAAPETIDFMTEEEYGRKYCAGHQDMYGAWDFSGASDVKELAARVIAPRGPFMLKIKKSVLKLPPKIEEVFTFSPSKQLAKELAAAEAALPKDFTNDPDLALQQYLKAGAGIDSDKDLHITTYLRLLGELKVPLTAEYIESILEETDEKILLYAHHRDAQMALRHALDAWEPLSITSSMAPEARQFMADTFQKRKDRRLLIGSLTTMIGYTLTAATRVFNMEPSWVNAVNDQASDRAHRFGQENSVLVQFGVFPNSLDGKVLAKLISKRQVTKHM